MRKATKNDMRQKLHHIIFIDASHGDRHLGMGACFHGIFLAIFLMVS